MIAAQKRGRGRGALGNPEQVRFIFMAGLVGVGSGLAAIIFRWLISWFHQFFQGYGRELLDVRQGGNIFLLPLIVGLGGLIVGILVNRFAREASGSGVPEVMDAVALRGGVVRTRVMLVKALASSVCIGSGGSAGREGPIVQICSALGSALARFFRLSSGRVKTLVACGAAGGISATFNAPIAGALFASELILGDFGVAAFTPVVISSVLAASVSHAFLGDQPAFDVPLYDLVSGWELGLYVVLGALLGVFSVVFSRMLYRTDDIFAALRIPVYLKPALGGALVGVVGIYYPQVFGVGYGTMEGALAGKMVMTTMLVFFALKMLATSLTLGSGGSGGVFAPSLFMGGMFGGAFGLLVHGWFPGATAASGAYALVGMGAMVAGTTHASLTAIIIIFEMTSDYRIILPLMAATIVATLVARGLQGESIYTMKLRRRGIKLRVGREQEILSSLVVKDVMRRKFESLPAGWHLKKVMDFVKTARATVYPVVNRQRKLVGMLSFEELRNVLWSSQQEASMMDAITCAYDVARSDVPTLVPEDSLQQAMMKFGLRHSEMLPVVRKGGSREVIGTVSWQDMVDAYDKELLTRTAEGK